MLKLGDKVTVIDGSWSVCIIHQDQDNMVLLDNSYDMHQKTFTVLAYNPDYRLPMSLEDRMVPRVNARLDYNHPDIRYNDTIIVDEDGVVYFIQNRYLTLVQPVSPPNQKQKLVGKIAIYIDCPSSNFFLDITQEKLDKIKKIMKE